MFVELINNIYTIILNIFRFNIKNNNINNLDKQKNSKIIGKKRKIIFEDNIKNKKKYKQDIFDFEIIKFDYKH